VAKCLKCNAEITKDDMYCQNCGFKLTTSEEKKVKLPEPSSDTSFSLEPESEEAAEMGWAVLLGDPKIIIGLVVLALLLLGVFAYFLFFYSTPTQDDIIDAGAGTLKKGLGASCYTDSECASGNCCSGICKPSAYECEEYEADKKKASAEDWGYGDYWGSYFPYYGGGGGSVPPSAEDGSGQQTPPETPPSPDGDGDVGAPPSPDDAGGDVGTPPSPDEGGNGVAPPPPPTGSFWDFLFT